MADVYRWAKLTCPSSGVRTWGPTVEAGQQGQGGGFGASGAGIPAGMYEARVIRWGRVTYGASFSDNSFSLRYPQQTLVVDEKDQMMSNLLGTGENIVKAPMEVHAAYVVNGAIVNQWDSVGVLVAPPSLSSDSLQASLTMQADDTAFKQEIINQIRQADFPNAPAQTLQHKIKGAHKAIHHTVATTSQPVAGVAAPIIYGLHDSAGISGTGACPVIHVDNVNFYGLVAWGRVTVLRAYKAGVRQTAAQIGTGGAGTVGSVIYPVIGGQLYTVIAFVADQSANQWTVDVQGYDSVGDGSGTALNAPGECMLHFLRNVVCLGTTPPVRGLWNTSGGNIVASDFTLSGLAKRGGGQGYKVSRHIATETTAEAEINSWASTIRVYPYIAPSGNLGVMLHDPSLAAVNWSDGSRWYRRVTQRDFEVLGQEFDQNTVSRVIVTPNALATGGNPTTPLTVDNPLSKSNASDSISLGWGLAAQ